MAGWMFGLEKQRVDFQLIIARAVEKKKLKIENRIENDIRFNESKSQPES